MLFPLGISTHLSSVVVVCLFHFWTDVSAVVLCCADGTLYFPSINAAVTNCADKAEQATVMGAVHGIQVRIIHFPSSASRWLLTSDF